MYLVVQNSPQTDGYGIYFSEYDTQSQQAGDNATITSLSSGFLGNALPVIAYTPNEQFILYRKDQFSSLKYVRRYMTLNGWSNWDAEASLPNSDSFSKYPSIAGVKSPGLDDIHIVFQSGDRAIKYIYSKLQGNNRPFSHYSDISTGGGYYYKKIYDILGKEGATLVNEQKNQGRYAVNFNASPLASGVYKYQIRVNDYVSSKKMLLLK